MYATLAAELYPIIEWILRCMKMPADMHLAIFIILLLYGSDRRTE